jgi:hypothetical protein
VRRAAWTSMSSQPERGQPVGHPAGVKTASWAALPARITVSKNVKCVLTTAQISPRFNVCGRGRPPHRSDYVGRYVFIASLPLLPPAASLVAAGVVMFLITGSRIAAAIVLPGHV